MVQQIREDYRKRLADFSRDGLRQLQARGYTERIGLFGEEIPITQGEFQCVVGTAHADYFFENGTCYSTNGAYSEHGQLIERLESFEIDISRLPFEKLQDHELLSVAERIGKALSEQPEYATS